MPEMQRQLNIHTKLMGYTTLMEDFKVQCSNLFSFPVRKYSKEMLPNPRTQRFFYCASLRRLMI